MKTLITLFVCVTFVSLQAQDKPCRNKDCPESLMSIALADPPEPELLVYTIRRTNRFIETYEAFENILHTYENDSEWEIKYEKSELTGEYCLRHYELEAFFAYESMNNEAFRAYIEERGLDAEQFKRQGFKSAKQGLNLINNMSSKCPSTIRRMKRNEEVNVNGLEKMYYDLGVDLGLIDPTEVKEPEPEEPIETTTPPENNEAVETDPPPTDPVVAETTTPPPSEPVVTQQPETPPTTTAEPPASEPEAPVTEPVTTTPPPVAEPDPSVQPLGDIEDMRKKDQVNLLKERVAELPNRSAVQPDIDRLADDLRAAQADANELERDLSTCEKVEEGVTADQNTLSDELAELQQSIQELASFEPRLPRPELSERFDDMTQKGQELSEELETLTNKNKALKDQLSAIGEEIDQTKEGITQRTSAKDDLNEQLEQLVAEKQRLENELADKARKKLDALIRQVGKAIDDANSLYKDIAEEEEKTDELVNDIANTKQEKESLCEELSELKEQVEALQEEKKALADAYDEAEKEVEAIKEEEGKMGNLQSQIDDLPSESNLREAINNCKTKMEELSASFPALSDWQGQIRDDLDKKRDEVSDLLERVIDLKSEISDLKLENSSDPLLYKVVRDADLLNVKVDNVREDLNAIRGGRTQTLEDLGSVNQDINQLKLDYNDQIESFNQLNSRLSALASERTNLNTQISEGAADLNQLGSSVNDFVIRYQAFVTETDCGFWDPLNKAKKEVENKQGNIDDQLNETDAALQGVNTQLTALEADLAGLKEKEGEETKKVEALHEEESRMQEEFGEDVKLEPVVIEEWSELEKVERDNWEANLQEDPELVEGYKGHYFEVKLKRADEVIAVLFPAGRYYMAPNAFNEQYGAAIGTFIYEATHHLDERKRVKLFIQGSADATGNDNFQGTMNQEYLYEEVDVLPQTETGFEKEFEIKEIPRSGFRNSDLPNLRAQYLKEVISFRSFDKLDAILLEGVVTDTEGEKERNATLFLFISDEILAGE